MAEGAAPRRGGESAHHRTPGTCTRCQGDGHEDVPLGRVARPEYPSARVITHLQMRGETFVLAILEGGGIELKLPLECSGRHALPLAEEVDDLSEERVKVHLGPSCPCGAAAEPAEAHGAVQANVC